MHDLEVGAKTAAERIIVAIDSTEPQSTLPLVDELISLGIRWYKVGLATWISGGASFVDALRSREARVFLDLKLHDIPHQVRLATAAAASSGAELLTIHSVGGPEMIRAAREGAGNAAKVLAVTVLTSLISTESEVLARGEQAIAAGADGLVCSPKEVSILRQTLGSEITLVTPGVRPKWAVPGDQKRVATPSQAVAAGSDLLVIGRPITQAAEPRNAAQRILDELNT
jgi:orotidine-5'-phosphate decarboxylase